MSAVTAEPNTTARVTSRRYRMRRARREPSTGMMRVTASSIAPPSRRKKNSMKSIMKKPTTVPMAPSATSPPMAAADRSSVCRPPVIQLSNCAALTQEFSRTHPTAPPMIG